MTAPSSTARRAAALPAYSSMRMVADWASAVRGEELNFGFDGTHATSAPTPGPARSRFTRAPSRRGRG